MTEKHTIERTHDSGRSDRVKVRCDCGQRIYDVVDGKVAIVAGTSTKRSRLVVEQREVTVIECLRCGRAHRA